MNTKIIGSIVTIAIVVSLGGIYVLFNKPPAPLPILDTAPNFQLVDENNNPVTLNTYSGKVVILDFIYTNCPDPNYCPASSLKMRDIQDGLIKSGISSNDVHLLSISFDYVYDGPIQMKNYGNTYQANFNYWSFLSGNESVINIAESYGVIAQVDVNASAGLIPHTLNLSVVDQNGNLRVQHFGSTWTSTKVISEVNNLLQES